MPEEMSPKGSSQRYGTALETIQGLLDAKDMELRECQKAMISAEHRVNTLERELAMRGIKLHKLEAANSRLEVRNIELSRELTYEKLRKHADEDEQICRSILEREALEEIGRLISVCATVVQCQKEQKESERQLRKKIAMLTFQVRVTNAVEMRQLAEKVRVSEDKALQLQEQLENRILFGSGGNVPTLVLNSDSSNSTESDEDDDEGSDDGGQVEEVYAKSPVRESVHVLSARNDATESRSTEEIPFRPDNVEIQQRETQLEVENDLHGLLEEEPPVEVMPDFGMTPPSRARGRTDRSLEETETTPWHRQSMYDGYNDDHMDGTLLQEEEEKDINARTTAVQGQPIFSHHQMSEFGNNSNTRRESDDEHDRADVSSVRSGVSGSATMEAMETAMSDLVYKLERSNVECSSLRDELETLRAANRTVCSEKVECERNISELQALLADKDEICDELEMETKTVTDRALSVEEELQQLIVTESELRENLTAEIKKSENLSIQVSELEAARDKLKRDLRVASFTQESSPDRVVKQLQQMNTELRSELDQVCSEFDSKDALYLREKEQMRSQMEAEIENAKKLLSELSLARESEEVAIKAKNELLTQKVKSEEILEHELAKVKIERENLIDEVKSMEQENISMHTAEEQLRQKHTETSLELEKLKGEKSTLSKEVLSLGGKNAELEQKVAELEESRATSVAKGHLLEADNRTVIESSSRVVQQHQETVAELEKLKNLQTEEIQKLSKETVSLQGEVVLLKEKVTQQEEANAAMILDAKKLEQENISMHTAEEQLRQKHAETSLELERLKGEKSTLSKEVLSLGGKNAELEQKVAELEDSNIALRQTSTESTDRLKENYISVKEALMKSERASMGLKVELAKCAKEISELKVKEKCLMESEEDTRKELLRMQTVLDAKQEEMKVLSDSYSILENVASEKTELEEKLAVSQQNESAIGSKLELLIETRAKECAKNELQHSNALLVIKNEMAAAHVELEESKRQTSALRFEVDHQKQLLLKNEEIYTHQKQELTDVVNQQQENIRQMRLLRSSTDEESKRLQSQAIDELEEARVQLVEENEKRMKVENERLELSFQMDRMVKETEEMRKDKQLIIAQVGFEQLIGDSFMARLRTTWDELMLWRLDRFNQFHVFAADRSLLAHRELKWSRKKKEYAGREDVFSKFSILTSESLERKIVENRQLSMLLDVWTSRIIPERRRLENREKFGHASKRGGVYHHHRDKENIMSDIRQKAQTTTHEGIVALSQLSMASLRKTVNSVLVGHSSTLHSSLGSLQLEEARCRSLLCDTMMDSKIALQKSLPMAL